MQKRNGSACFPKLILKKANRHDPNDIEFALNGFSPSTLHLIVLFALDMHAAGKRASLVWVEQPACLIRLSWCITSGTI